MNGAESLVHTLLASGVEVCFANPGTSEMHFVSALDRVPGMRCVLCLAEGVATGAADGYARMTGRPAATLLHCSPGLENGLAYLHNARRARSPVVNIVGDIATYHTHLDPPLTSDTESVARIVSAFVRTSRTPAAVGADAAEAVRAARTPPGVVATLVLPSDASWGEGGVVAAPLAAPAPATVDDAAIAAAAAALTDREPAVILLGGEAMRPQPLADAARIAAATGARLRGETFNARWARGHGRPFFPALAYAVDSAVADLAGTRRLVLAGAVDPVGFFAYPGKPGRMAPENAEVVTLARPGTDIADALARLADRLGAPPVAAPGQPRPAPPGGAVTGEALGVALAALMPDDAIVIDESVSFGMPLQAGIPGAPPYDWLRLVGGAIGGGIPLAVGAAIGAPGRRVIALQADGSALYTVAGLWTEARENLDITTIVLANRRYAILDRELAAVGATNGAIADSLFSLARPTIDWLRLAGGLGIEAARAETMTEFADLFVSANRRSGPFLIELVIP
jgi:acetolactate synthase-1/2/3 large subunit